MARGERELFTFARRLGATVASQGAALALGVAFVVLATRWLGAADRGHQAFLISVGQITAILLGLGVSNALPAALALDRRRVSSALRVVGATTLFATAMCALLAAVVSKLRLLPEAEGHGALLTAFVAASVAQQALTVLAVSAGDVSTYNTAGIVSGSVALLLLVGLRFVDAVGVASAVAAQMIALAVASVWSMVRLGSFQTAEQAVMPIRRLVGAASLGLLSNLFGMAMLRGDLLVVSRLAGMADAGVYSVAVFVGELTLRIPQWAGQLHSPSVAADSNDASVARTVDLFVAAVAVNFAVFVGAGILRPVGAWAFSRAAGPEFAVAYDLMLALGPRFVMQGGVAILAAFLAGRGYTLFHPAASLVGLLGVVGLDLVLVPRMGVAGASVASSIGYVGAAAVFLWGFLVHGKLTVRSFLGQLARTPKRLLTRNT